MLLFAPVAALALAWLVVGITLGGLTLWLVGKIFQVDSAGWRRSFGVATVCTVLGLTLFGVALAAGQIHPWLTGACLLAAVLLLLLTLMRLLQLRAGRAILVWLMWALFLAPCGAVAALGVWLFWFDHYIVPTGAMAETVYGYHKQVPCPECGHVFAVNASAEVDTSSDRPRVFIVQCECPNCRADINFNDYGLNIATVGGDRILCTTRGYGELQRQQIVAFRYPVEPQRGGVKLNYLKRLIGLPGETIAIAQGDLYVYQQPRNVPLPDRLWESPFSGYPWRGETDEQRQAHQEAEQLFAAGKFRILRKSPDQLLAMRQLVHDNHHRGKCGAAARPRWRLADRGEQATPADAATGSFVLAEAAGERWLRYAHYNQPTAATSQLITDFSGYNSGNDGFRNNGVHWVGDLILECQVEIEKNQGELRLELSKGSERFQAVFELASGQCSLARLRPAEKRSEPLGSQPTALQRPGKNRLRFANVDDRLTVWVNEALVFGEGLDYAAAAERGPTTNDLEPASIGVIGTAATITDLKLWRDLYYTTYSPGMSKGGDVALSGTELSAPANCGQPELRKPTPMLMYVPAGHYLFLGDNSPASADSRSWGLVPASHIIGPAVYRYFPPRRSGPLR